MRVRVRAREGIIELFTIGFFNCCSVVPFIDNTTNKPLFYIKRAVVFGKMSRCFVQNEPLFCVKRAVVLCKMSRRFTQVLRNGSLHLVDFWEGQCPRGVGTRKEG